MQRGLDKEYRCRTAQSLPDTEIVQLGFTRLVGRQQMLLLDLETMQPVPEPEISEVTKIMGQKMFMATRRGV